MPQSASISDRTYAIVSSGFACAASSSNYRSAAAILCHNLCCLLHAMYELGIDPKLTEPGAVPTILKFTGVG